MCACFQEVDVGLAADLGTLQRLPKVIGNDSLMRELVYTARKMFAGEAKEFGLVRWGDQEMELNRACHPGGHYWNYYPGAMPSSQVTATHVKMGMKLTGAWSSGELQRLDYMTGYQDSSPSDGRQETCSILDMLKCLKETSICTICIYVIP